MPPVNGISARGAAKLAVALRHSQTLAYVYLQGVPLGAAGLYSSGGVVSSDFEFVLVKVYFIRMCMDILRVW